MNEKIIHKPNFDIKSICEHYTKKDGVNINYVCTTALNHGTQSVDIFYRETPHPSFGNYYFGIYCNNVKGGLYITNADIVEELEFNLIKDDDDSLHYSRHRHDYVVINNGNMIDGGRAYVRTNTNNILKYVVRKGQMIQKV